MTIKGDANITKQLLSFLEVAKTGKIKLTAEKNSIKQSNLSKSLSELEDDLDLKLFNRLQNGVTLTNDGETIFNMAISIPNSIEKIRAYANDSHLTTGEVRLWSSEGLASGYFVSFLDEFYTQYPNIQLNINCSTESPQTIHEADIAIVYKMPSQSDAIIIDEQILKFDLFASKSYLSRYGFPKDINDLCENHKICNKESYCNLWNDWDNILNKAKNINTITNSSNMLIQLIFRGIGIGLLPRGINVENNNLVRLEKLNLETSHPFWIVSHKMAKDIPKVRALIDHIQKVTK